MKLVVFGSRTWTDSAFIQLTLDTTLSFRRGYDGAILRDSIDWVVHGACPTGADHFADLWARQHDYQIKRFPADWKAFGNAAGPIRNEMIVRELDPARDYAISFRAESASRGTDGMRALLHEARIQGRVYYPSGAYQLI